MGVRASSEAKPALTFDGPPLLLLVPLDFFFFLLFALEASSSSSSSSHIILTNSVQWLPGHSCSLEISSSAPASMAAYGWYLAELTTHTLLPPKALPMQKVSSSSS
ncbi:hypothetical protein ABW19_dt0209554 [Dactylella cylindrospora]|nr:hypothetical protein ABW19_dt0209554 [Dactylella cylindrospora]